MDARRSLTSAAAAAAVSHQDMANAIRVLAMDAVERAKSGHPGMPMGMADVATVLFTRFLKFDPAHPGCPTCFPIVKSVLEKWLTATTREEAVRLLLDLGFSAGPVQTVKEVYECEQLQKRHLFIEIEDGLGGIIRTVGTPVKFSGFQPQPPRRAPFLGEHTREVLIEMLGLTEAELDCLGLRSDSSSA